MDFKLTSSKPPEAESKDAGIPQEDHIVLEMTQVDESPGAVAESLLHYFEAQAASTVSEEDVTNACTAQEDEIILLIMNQIQESPAVFSEGLITAAMSSLEDSPFQLDVELD